MQKHGQIQHFLEWGSRHGDYDCLSAGLAKAGRPDLLPPKHRTAERPLIWWNAVRQRTTIAPLKISLRLGDLYKVVFPYNSRLRRNWHHAGADVQMTAHLIEEYFRRAQRKTSERTLDFYFPHPDAAIREPRSISERQLELQDDDLTSMMDELDTELAFLDEKSGFDSDVCDWDTQSDDSDRTDRQVEQEKFLDLVEDFTDNETRDDESQESRKE
jgi:hypothetical protein